MRCKLYCGFTVLTCIATPPCLRPPHVTQNHVPAFRNSRIGSHANVIGAVSVSLERLVIVFEKADTDLWTFLRSARLDDSVSNSDIMR